MIVDGHNDVFDLHDLMQLTVLNNRISDSMLHLNANSVGYAKGQCGSCIKIERDKYYSIQCEIEISV